MPDIEKAPKYPVIDDIEVPAKAMENWQTTVDLLAEVSGVPAALIMRVHAREIEVLVASRNSGNPYQPGEKAPLDIGLYCETVMSTRNKLLVPNALKDPAWDHNPDIKLGMISYCGLPLVWPNGEIFGTICILDGKENAYMQRTHQLLERFRDSVQFSLESIYTASVERRQAKEALNSARGFIQQLISSASVMIVGLDPAGRLKVFNPAAEKITGYTLEELSDMNWFDKIVPKDRYPYVWEIFRNYQQDHGVMPAEFENPILTKSGGERFISWQNSTVSAPGAEISTISFGLDITERKRAERKIQELNLDLVEKNEEMENFLYITSHNLRGPLVNIQGFSQNLEHCSKELRDTLAAAPLPPETEEKLGKLAGESIPEALKYVMAGSRRMDSLITALLKVSRMGRVEIKPETVEMTVLLKKILEAMRYQLDEAAGKVSLGDLPRCWADQVTVDRIFANLLDNAVKYRHKDRPLVISVTGEVRGGMAVYKVADNGSGIPAADIHMIWDLFYRAAAADAIKGEGVGLSLVKRLIKKNGGSIRAESKEGEGSAFYVELPARS